MNYLGLMIKSERLKQEISQEALCHGICSNSYLSKIENASVNASDEIYDLLFRRLNIQYYTLDEAQEVKKSIMVFFDDLLFIKETDTEQLQKLFNEYLYSPYHLLIRIAEYRLQIYLEKKLDPSYRQLEDFVAFFTAEEHYHYTLIKAYAADDNLDAIEILKPQLFYKSDGYVQNEIAIRYFYYGDYSLALQYCQKAYELFSQSGNIRALVETAIFIGSSYGNLENIPLTIQWFTTVRNINLVLNDASLEFNANYNIGATYTTNAYYTKGYPYLLACYSYLQQDNCSSKPFTFNTYQKLINAEIALNKLKEADSHLKEYQKKYVVPAEYEDDLILLQYKVENPGYLKDSAYLELLENTYQASKARKHFGNAKYYARELITAYQLQRNYKKASELALEYAYAKPIV